MQNQTLMAIGARLVRDGISVAGQLWNAVIGEELQCFSVDRRTLLQIGCSNAKNFCAPGIFTDSALASLSIHSQAKTRGRRRQRAPFEAACTGSATPRAQAFTPTLKHNRIIHSIDSKRETP